MPARLMHHTSGARQIAFTVRMLAMLVVICTLSPALVEAQSYVVTVAPGKLAKIEDKYSNQGYRIKHRNAKHNFLVVAGPSSTAAAAAAAEPAAALAAAGKKVSGWLKHGKFTPGGVEDLNKGKKDRRQILSPAASTPPSYNIPLEPVSSTARAAAAAAAVKQKLQSVDGVLRVEENPTMRLLGRGRGLSSSSPSLRLLAAAGGREVLDMQRPATCPTTVSNNPDNEIGKVTEDAPYWVKMVQADTPAMVAISRDYRSKVLFCVIDTGLDNSNPEFESSTTSGCVPNTYRPNGTPYNCTHMWNQDNDGHGTHTSGTIAARRNGRSIVGISAEGANMYHYNIFGNGVDFEYSSVVAAWDDCIAELEYRKAATSTPDMKLVISMSFGGSGDLQVASEALINIASQRSDVLFVAAAGNSNSSLLSYPAASPGVVSVAAVDWDTNLAWFSTYNWDVEWAGPGVGVLSTVPMWASGGSSYNTEPLLSITPFNAPPSYADLLTNPRILIMIGSGRGTVTGEMVDCGLGAAPCANAAGKICLLQRGGDIYFCRKVLNCVAGGGIGALVYGRDDQPECEQVLYATLVSTECSTPAGGYPVVLSASRVQGEGIKAYIATNPSAVVRLTTGSGSSSLEFLSGTSMSTPAVAGAAGLVWSAHTKCTAAEIRAAISNTAQDRGSPGRDPQFGFGIVKAQAAHEYLNANPCAGPPAVNCIGNWTEWGNCIPGFTGGTCGLGIQVSKFNVTREAVNGGWPCIANHDAVRYQSCQLPPCPVNCVGSWSDYGQCTCTESGGAFQSSTFNITKAAAFGGTNCTAAHGEVRNQSCTPAAACPVSCIGNYTEYGPCLSVNGQNCGPGISLSTFLITRNASNGGQQCNITHGSTGNLTCETGVVCPVACAGSWSGWGPCSAACGGGLQYSNFTITVPAVGTGQACEAANGDIRNQTCNPQDCFQALNDVEYAVSGQWTALKPLINDAGAVAHIDRTTQPVRGGTVKLQQTPVRAGSSGQPAPSSVGIIMYLSKAGFKGQDSFTYTISAANGVESTATVTVIVGAGSCAVNRCGTGSCNTATGKCVCPSGTGLTNAFIPNPEATAREVTPRVPACRFRNFTPVEPFNMKAVKASAGTTAAVTFSLSSSGLCLQEEPVSRLTASGQAECPDSMPAAPMLPPGTGLTLGASSCTNGVYSVPVRVPKAPGCYNLVLRLVDGTARSVLLQAV